MQIVLIILEDYIKYTLSIQERILYMKRFEGFFYAIGSAIAFGFMPFFAKIAYSAGATAVSTVFYRFILAALMLFAYFKIAKIEFKIKDKKQLRKIIFLSVFGYAATCITLFLSYNYVSVGLATTLHFIYPGVVVLLCFFLYKEKLGLGKLICLLLSLVGIYVLIGFGDSKFSITGAILAMVSGIFYSIYIIELGHNDLKGINSLVLTFYVSVFAAIGTFVYGIFTQSLVFDIELKGIFAIIALAYICTVVALMAFAKAIKLIGSANAAILSTMEPITSIALGIIFFREPMTISIALGSLLILVSMIKLTVQNSSKDNTEKDI